MFFNGSGSNRLQLVLMINDSETREYPLLSLQRALLLLLLLYSDCKTLNYYFFIFSTLRIALFCNIYSAQKMQVYKTPRVQILKYSAVCSTLNLKGLTRVIGSMGIMRSPSI